MASAAASLRPALSSCSRCSHPHLRRTALSQSLARTFHLSPRTGSPGAATAAAAAAPAEQGGGAAPEYALPRTKIYQHTRPQPRAPVRTRATPVEVFKVNDDQAVLEEMYGRLFGQGPDGAKLLPPELMWQAVTHISFDHARQPYNNKLAFLGRRILFFHTNLHILNLPRSPAADASTPTTPPTAPTSDSPPPSSQTTPAPSSAAPTPAPPPVATVATVSSDTATYLAPTPFDHPDYKNLDAATYDAIGRYTEEEALARVAKRAGIQHVMRWKPANPKDLTQSGLDTVVVDCLYGIIGAIALSKGGLQAKQFVARILEQGSL